MSKLEMSYTKASVFQHCPKRYWWKYVERLQPKAPKKPPLILGVIVHQLLHQLYTGTFMDETLETILDEMMKENPLSQEEELFDAVTQAAELVRGYAKKWKEDPIKMVSSEVHLQHEFDNYILYGRVDALGRTPDGRLWRIEHKTSSRADSYYLGGLRAGLQGGLYHFLLEKNLGENVSGTVYNMLIKTKVPDYPRMYVNVKPAHVKRSLETMEGIVRAIDRADFYPSSDCFTWNEECPYMKLCDADSEQTRHAFYEPVPERKEGGVT